MENNTDYNSYKGHNEVFIDCKKLTCSEFVILHKSLYTACFDNHYLQSPTNVALSAFENMFYKKGIFQLRFDLKERKIAFNTRNLRSSIYRHHLLEVNLLEAIEILLRKPPKTNYKYEDLLFGYVDNKPVKYNCNKKVFEADEYTVSLKQIKPIIKMYECFNNIYRGIIFEDKTFDILDRTGERFYINSSFKLYDHFIEFQSNSNNTGINMLIGCLKITSGIVENYKKVLKEEN